MTKKYFEIEFHGREISPEEIENMLNAVYLNVRVCHIEVLSVIEVEENNIPKKENLN